MFIVNHKIKKIFAAGLLILTLGFSVAQGTEISAASIQLNKKNITLYEGNCYTLKVKGTTKTVTWKSSNKKIVTVSKRGKVTARNRGTATITAKAKSKSLRCKVIVKKKQATSTPSPVPTGRPISTQKPISTSRPTATPSPTKTPETTTYPSTSSVTENSAYATLNSLRSTYPEGMTLTNSYYYYSPQFGNGYGCYGFAAKLSDTVFGTQKAYTTHSSFDKIKVGDNIRIGNYHSVIVLTKGSNYITVVEGNYNSSVHWDRKITSSSLSSEGFQVYTRY